MISEKRDTVAFLLASELKSARANDEPLSTEPILETEKQPVIPWLCSRLGGCYKQTEAGNKNLLWDAASRKEISMVRHCWIEEAEKDSIMMMKTFLHLLIKDLVQEEFIHVETWPPTILSKQRAGLPSIFLCVVICHSCYSYQGFFVWSGFFPRTWKSWSVECLWTCPGSPLSSSLI